MQILPAPQLREYIKHYLWVQKSPAVDGQLHIFGDGNPGIAFCYEGCLYQDAQLQIPLPRIFSYGQINTHQTIYAPQKVHLLIVVLQPFALSALLHTSASSISKLILDESELYPYLNREKAFQLLEVKTLAMRINALDTLMCASFCKQQAPGLEVVAATVQYISKVKGKISSGGLVQFTGFGERYLEKQFKEHVGLSPTKFARTIRMLSYIKLLQITDNKKTLTELAYQAGYFDQAHLNHDFKKLTGLTPSAFAAKRQALALNFFTIRKD